MKILIAEDDMTSRRLLEVILKRLDYDIVVTHDGTEAWEALRQADAPQVAILDWMMPGMDGVQVCRRIRQEKTGIPTYIIMLTTRDSREDIIQGLEAGANDYVTKPFDASELHARIQVGRRVLELETTLEERVRELQETIVQLKSLQGLLPICMHCHKIHDDRASWQRLEQYIEAHTDARFSHGICPECEKKYYNIDREKTGQTRPRPNPEPPPKSKGW